MCWLHDYLYKESEAENSPHQYFNIKTSAEVVNDVVIGIRVQIANSFKTFSWSGEKHQIFTATLSSEHYDYLKPKIKIFEEKKLGHSKLS